jgi:uncharacterized LabA/DUF88 family protein
MILFVFFLFVFLRTFEKPKYNIKICDEMSSDELKLMCYAMFSGNYKHCSLLGPSYSFCIDFVSSAIQVNPNVCNLLEGSEFYSCYYSLSSYLDYLKINEDFCNRINEESLKFICLAKLKKDVKLCENIVQEPLEKWNCLATISRNMSYCYKSDNFNYCLLLVALEEKNPETCEKIETAGNKIDCLLRIKKDISVCDELKGSWKDFCILNFLQLKNLNII